MFLIDPADRLAVVENVPLFEVREGMGLLNPTAAKSESHVANSLIEAARSRLPDCYHFCYPTS